VLVGLVCVSSLILQGKRDVSAGLGSHVRFGGLRHASFSTATAATLNLNQLSLFSHLSLSLSSFLSSLLCAVVAYAVFHAAHLLCDCLVQNFESTSESVII